MEMIAIAIDFGGVKHRSKTTMVNFLKKNFNIFDTQQHKFSSMLLFANDVLTLTTIH